MHTLLRTPTDANAGFESSSRYAVVGAEANEHGLSGGSERRGWLIIAAESSDKRRADGSAIPQLDEVVVTPDTRPIKQSRPCLRATESIFPRSTRSHVHRCSRLARQHGG